MLPHSEESEKSILGSMLKSTNAVTDVLQKVERNMFFSTKNRRIFRAIQTIYAEDVPIDQLSLINFLKDKDILDSVGGAYYITGLVDFSVSDANIKYHINTLKRKFIAREMITSLQDRLKDLRNNDDPMSIAGKISNDIMQIQDTNRHKPYHNFKDSVNSATEHIQKLYDNETLPGIETGYIDFDALTGGYQPGLHIIAARPSMGKTAWAVNQSHNMAKKGHSIGYISLETEKEWIAMRKLSRSTKVNSQKFNTSNLSEEEFIKLMQTADNFKDKFNIYIDDSFDSKIEKITAKIRAMKKLEKIEIAFVDYLQLIQGNNRQNRNLEVGDITRKLAKTSKQIKIPVVLLSQLSRSAEGKMPKLSHLRDSGEIEQDADSVTFIYRPEQNDRYIFNDEDTKNKAWIKIAKWRNGKTGNFKLRWLPEYTSFENYINDDIVKF